MLAFLVTVEVTRSWYFGCPCDRQGHLELAFWLSLCPSALVLRGSVPGFFWRRLVASAGFGEPSGREVTRSCYFGGPRDCRCGCCSL